MYYCLQCEKEWQFTNTSGYIPNTENTLPLGNNKEQCPHCSGTLHYGWKQNCPQCKVIRHTTCCACGCGNCMSCGYRFSCMVPFTSTLIQNGVLNKNYDIFQFDSPSPSNVRVDYMEGIPRNCGIVDISHLDNFYGGVGISKDGKIIENRWLDGARYWNKGAAMEHKVDQAKTILNDWVTKQGHDRCWYYPDLFNQLYKLFFNTEPPQQSLPSRSEFEKGCCQYQNEQYGNKLTTEDLISVTLNSGQIEEIYDWAVKEVNRIAYEEMWKSVENLDGY